MENKKSINIEMKLEFWDKMNVEKCNMLLCCPDDQLLSYTNHEDYNEEENKDYIKTIKNYLKSFINRADTSTLSVLRTYKIKPCGRMYCDGSGLQYFSNNILHYILPENCVEYDMSNCHPHVLLHLYKKHNLPHSNLKNYCKNRDVLLPQWDVDKKEILKLFNQDKPDLSSRGKGVRDLIDEVQGNKLDIIRLECDTIRNDYEPKTKTSWNSEGNPNSSKQCAVCFYYENMMLHKALDCVQEKDSIVVPKYDGFITNENISIDTLNKVTEEYGLTWAKKTPSTPIPDNIPYDEKTLTEILADGENMVFVSDANNPRRLAEKIAITLSSRLKYSFEGWYCLNLKTSLWSQDQHPHYDVIGHVSEGIDNAKKYYNKKFEGEERDEKIKELNKLYAKIDCASYSSQLIKHLMKKLKDDDFYRSLDNTPYKVYFRNGYFDIKERQFFEGVAKGDFITKTISFDYAKFDKDKFDDKFENCENCRWIKEQLRKICNCNDEHLRYYMSVLSYALTGDPSKYQHFYFLVGQKAGNGKSKILEILTNIIPEYVKKCDSLLLESNYSKRHKIAGNLKTHRIVWLDEMKAKSNICVKTMKMIADGGNYENEVLYKTQAESFPIAAKVFLISNHTIRLDESDQGAARRYIHFQFDSMFRPEFEDDFETKKFKADLDLEAKFKSRKMEFLHLLLHYANVVYQDGLPSTPDDFTQEKEDVMASNNEFLDWFQDNTAEAADGVIAKRDIQDKYFEKTNSNIDSKDVVDKLKQIGVQYKRSGQKNGCRGTFIGYEWDFKGDFIESSEEDELDFVKSSDCSSS
jgi:phage/plasmid-associated DNA primase